MSWRSRMLKMLDSWLFFCSMLKMSRSSLTVTPSLWLCSLRVTMQVSTCLEVIEAGMSLTWTVLWECSHLLAYWLQVCWSVNTFVFYCVCLWARMLTWCLHWHLAVHKFLVMAVEGNATDITVYAVAVSKKSGSILLKEAEDARTDCYLMPSVDFRDWTGMEIAAFIFVSLCVVVLALAMFLCVRRHQLHERQRALEYRPLLH